MKRIITIFSIFFLFGCENDKPKEIFLIPENIDNFVVIYEAEKKIDFRNDIIYNIPKNGILKVNFQRNKGILNHKYYLVSDNGKEKIEILNFAYEEYRNNIKNDKKYELDGLDGSYIDNRFIDTKGNKIELSTSKKWFGIIIGKVSDNQNELRGKLLAKIDSISKK